MSKTRNKSKVAVIKTNPKDVIEDYSTLMDLADFNKVMHKTKDTIIKLNLSWSLYYPACSTEPWQLDGLLNKMKTDGFDLKKVHAVENQTVVTKPWKGAYLNKWLGILEKYKMEFEPLTNVKWKEYKPKADLPALRHLFGETALVPEIFFGNDVF